MGQAVKACARRWVERMFLRDLDSGYVYSYAETEQRIDQVVASQAAHGIRRGDSVATNFDNSSDLVFLILASLVAGTRLALIEPQTPAQRLTYFLKMVKPKAVFLTPQEGNAASTSDLYVFCRMPWSGGVAPKPVSQPGESLTQRDDEAFVIFSSGTTGEPKGIVHSHSNAIHELDAMIEGYGAHDLRKHHLILPLPHVSGLYRSLLMPFCTGGTVTMRRLFNPQTFWKDVLEQKVEFVQLVPSHVALLNRSPHGPSSGRASSLRFVGTASAYLPPKEQRTFETRFGVPVLQGYGLTECTCGITLNSLDPKIRRPGVVGRPLPVNEIRLVDTAGLEVEPGEVGEVQVRGRNLATRFLGYAGPSFQDGWLKTGDMGRVEEDGNIVLIGRNTNIVNRGAYKIYTREVEEALGASAGVEEAVVIGVPHPLLGEDLVAFVMPERVPAPLQLLGALRRTLSSYKIPSRIIPIAEIPKNKMGKVLREALVQRLADRPQSKAPVEEGAITAQICRIIAELFALNPSDIDTRCSRDRVPQWDSLGHVQVLAAIEQTFGVRLADEGAVTARTISDLVSLVRYTLRTKLEGIS